MSDAFPSRSAASTIPRSGKRPLDELIGNTYNSLTVLRFSGINRHRSFYFCRCVCGREVLVDGSKIKNGHTRSCGCYKRGLPNLKKRKAPGESMRNRIIWSYRGNGKRKGIPFELTDEQAIAFFESDCFYCGRPPATVSRRPGHWGEYTYNGIDRVDNELGYTVANCVAACLECNHRKASQDVKDFLDWARRIAARHPA